jgi:stage II sporulation SpoE-like protein
MRCSSEQHQYYGILTRALGVGSDVEIDQTTFAVEEGDRIVLCSDGLFNERRSGCLRDPDSEALTLPGQGVSHSCRSVALDNRPAPGVVGQSSNPHRWHSPAGVHPAKVACELAELRPPVCERQRV